MLPSRKKTIKALLYLYLPMLYVSLGTMISVYSTKVPFIDWIRLFLSFAGVIIIVKSVVIVKLHKSNFFLIVLSLMLLMLLSTFFKHVDSFRPESVREIADSILWGAVLVIAYIMSYKHQETLECATYLTWIIPLFTLVFMNLRKFFILNDVEDIAMLSTAYYPLFLLPLVLLNKNTVIKWGLIFFIFITILFSSKRGGFIVLFVALAINFFVSLRQKKSLKKMLPMLIGGGIGIYLLITLMNLFISQNDLSILERLGNIQDDGGSGRDFVWAYTWRMITEESNVLPLLFGHGFNAVYSDSMLELSAHNDFLEIIYDYGFIGLLLYFALYVQLFSYYKRIKKHLPNVAGAFAASIAMALCISMVAHLVINPILFMFLCLFWGLYIGECDKKIKQKYG